MSDTLTLESLLFSCNAAVDKIAGMSAATTACTAPKKEITATEILARMEQASELLQRQRQGILVGIAEQVIEHTLPPVPVPNRKHKKRRNQTEAYHRRVQKKWAKRWGTHLEQRAYLVDLNAVSFFKAAHSRPAWIVPIGLAAALR